MNKKALFSNESKAFTFLVFLNNSLYYQRCHFVSTTRNLDVSQNKVGLVIFMTFK